MPDIENNTTISTPTVGSVLNDVKYIIGINPSDTSFDSDLILDINTVLFTLNQMGLCKPNAIITGESTVWSDILTTTQVNLHALKTWIGLRVKLIFDPPTSSIVKQALDENIKEYEWRIYITENYVGEIQ